MAKLEQRIVDNINNLILQCLSDDKLELSIAKLLIYINTKFRIVLDEPAIEELLSDNKAVKEIVDGKIILGSSTESDEEESVDEDIHDIAVDQAADNMSMESVQLNDVLALYENVKIGNTIDPKDVILEETDPMYFLNNGVKKAKTQYIITDIVPSTTIEESKVRCKVDGQFLIVDLPITSIK